MKEMIDVSKVNHRKLDSVNQMIAVAQKYPFVKRLIIFGSAVTDHCTDESDIDVCADIELKEKGLNLHNLHVDLCKTCNANCDILIYERLKGKIKSVIDTKGVTVYASGKGQC